MEEIKSVNFASKWSAKKTWNAVLKRRHNERELTKFVAKREPTVATVMDFNSCEESYYPELDGVILIVNDNKKPFEKLEDALEVAKKCKEFLKSELKRKDKKWRLDKIS